MNEELKKEVEALTSQGYNESQIKGALTEKGYNINEINEAIYIPRDISNKNKKFSKKNIIFSIIILFIISILVFGVFSFVKHYKFSPVYTENPKNWISSDNQSYKIEVGNIPGGVLSYEEGYNQQYNNGIINTAFIIEGYYNNEFFKNYYDNGTIHIHIGENINPDDEYMDIMISETFFNGTPYIDIFLDSIWQEKLGAVNIWYGIQYENYQAFNFSRNNEIKKGIYHNRIKDDISRFIENSDPLQKTGGLIIGDINREDWINQTLKNKIVIRFN